MWDSPRPGCRCPAYGLVRTRSRIVQAGTLLSSVHKPHTAASKMRGPASPAAAAALVLGLMACLAGARELKAAKSARIQGAMRAHPARRAVVAVCSSLCETLAIARAPVQATPLSSTRICQTATPAGERVPQREGRVSWLRRRTRPACDRTRPCRVACCLPPARGSSDRQACQRQARQPASPLPPAAALSHRAAKRRQARPNTLRTVTKPPMPPPCPRPAGSSAL